MLNNPSLRRIKGAAKLTYVWDAIAALGLKLPTLFWAAVGGVLSAFLREGSLGTRVLSGVVGFLFAVTIGPILARLMLVAFGAWGVSLTIDDVLPGAGFLTGTVGMVLVEAILASVVRVRSHLPDFVSRKLGR